MHDCLIIGGGPAGLSAALNLVRIRRTARIIDAGRPRHLVAEGIQSNITNAGRDPIEFRRIAHDELAAYGDLFSLRQGHVVEIRGEKGAFRLVMDDGSVDESKRVLLATGVVDEFPDIPGLTEKWGTYVHHCPWCWGWEIKDQRLGLIFDKPEAVMKLRVISELATEAVGFWDSEEPAPESVRADLTAAGIKLIEGRVLALVDSDGVLSGVEVHGAGVVPVDHVYISPGQHHPPPVQALGLELDETGAVVVDDNTFETSVPGMFAAGDLITLGKQQVHFAIHTGARAGGMMAVDLIAGLPQSK